MLPMQQQIRFCDVVRVGHVVVDRCSRQSLRDRTPARRRGGRSRAAQRHDPVRPRRRARGTARGVGALGGHRSRCGAVGGAAGGVHRGLERSRPHQGPRLLRRRLCPRGSSARGNGRIEGAEAYVDSIVALWDLAPDQRLVFGWSWPMVERRGIVLTGTREGRLDRAGLRERYVCSISPPAAA